MERSVAAAPPISAGEQARALLLRRVGRSDPTDRDDCSCCALCCALCLVNVVVDATGGALLLLKASMAAVDIKLTIIGRRTNTIVICDR
mmetsp:Transcript_19111/g.20574  ORF Transcript_19111/g.20574 Transcript_19111/m.20574 type:complete len:89 (-) Transcript_19111:92-358(-)